jgi:phosphomevalonate kinase
VRARPPGKLVLSGAYAVLEGAPALVAAVDRYVEADGSRAATFEAAEVLEAVRRGLLVSPPWFDASSLRSDGRKLGLGSSAAILAASLAAGGFGEVLDEALAAAIFPVALEVHRAAQGGGSGVDVAAACFGGVCRCELVADGALAVAPHALPPDLVIEVFACDRSASTRDMLACVRELEARDPDEHRAIMSEIGAGARVAVAAREASAFIAALRHQLEALAALGRAAGCPIVTEEIASLDRLAGDAGACFAPSGAGGGDMALHHGPAPATAAFREAAERAGLSAVPLEIGARGLHRIAP